ncbi:piggyBac transposable element-derived protein 4 [Nephila pilipes]|uniref:PiggyBac transposable element-derived protein 4 n=1 Tax=Nephila pilipes TaxID=299642 RepID=A0A8X6NV09_NEPPI|nr:piggyBac transposable element-derived protein 4 [Nephila pilipes]
MIQVVRKSLLSDFSSDEEMEMLDDFTQVRNFCEIDTGNPTLAPSHIPFTVNPAVHLNNDISDGTLQILDIFFDDNLLEMIVAETNQYADRFIRNSNLQRNSKTRKREPKTKNENQVFITLNILQGNVKRTDVEHFWNDIKFDAKMHEGPKLHKLLPVIRFHQSFQLGYCSEKKPTVNKNVIISQ